MFIVYVMFTHKKNTLREMQNNSIKEVSPERLNMPGNSKSICWKYVKLMEDNDPRITKYAVIRTHHCAICNMTLSLSCTDIKNRKYCKANGNYQNAQEMLHLTKENNDLSDTVE